MVDLGNSANRSLREKDYDTTAMQVLPRQVQKLPCVIQPDSSQAAPGGPWTLPNLKRESCRSRRLAFDKDIQRFAVRSRVPLEQSGAILFRVHPATTGGLGPFVRAFVQVCRAWAGQVRIIATGGIHTMAARKS